MNKSDKVIMFDSAEAATHRTDISGWVSAEGIFCGDSEAGEQAARYTGCTHRICGTCGEPTEKMYIMCPACRHKDDIARYEALEYKKWDGKTPLYSHQLGEFMFDEPEEFLNDQKANSGAEGEVVDLRLVICEPRSLSHIDDDYWMDDLPEDCEMPDEAIEALEEFHKILDDIGTVSWWAGNYRTSIEDTTP